MHKTIGILGGMSPESTAEYYQYLTRTYTEHFGDYSYPEIIIYSVNFQPYVDWPKQGRWDLVAQGLGQAAQKLQAAGADFILIATNTMHIVFNEVQASVDIPVLSMLDAVGQAIQAQSLPRVGLLGTKFTMEAPLYPEALAHYGITVLVPGPQEQEIINQVIYDELVAGQIRDASRAQFVEIIHNLAQQGAEGIILGCTEIPLLVSGDDVALSLFDTTKIHAEAALNYALDEAS